MPWQIRRQQSAIRVDIDAPVGGEWENILDAIREKEPSTVYLPSELPEADRTDAMLLKMLWVVLGAAGISVLPWPQILPG